jgi:hypothetical protein
MTRRVEFPEAAVSEELDVFADLGVLAEVERKLIAETGVVGIRILVGLTRGGSQTSVKFTSPALMVANLWRIQIDRYPSDHTNAGDSARRCAVLSVRHAASSGQARFAL